MKTIKCIYISETVVIDPDSGEDVTLEIWKDPSSGSIFAVDASFVDQVRSTMPSPYNTRETLDLGPPI
jgi:hypothetical protein